MGHDVPVLCEVDHVDGREILEFCRQDRDSTYFVEDLVGYCQRNRHVEIEVDLLPLDIGTYSTLPALQRARSISL